MVPLFAARRRHRGVAAAPRREVHGPGPAGGAIDNPARAIAKGLSEILKEQVITLNLPGAGGTIATARVANAAPDGYTVLFHHIGVATAPA